MKTITILIAAMLASCASQRSWEEWLESPTAHILKQAALETAIATVLAEKPEMRPYLEMALRALQTHAKQHDYNAAQWNAALAELERAGLEEVADAASQIDPLTAAETIEEGLNRTGK